MRVHNDVRVLEGDPRNADENPVHQSCFSEPNFSASNRRGRATQSWLSRLAVSTHTHAMSPLGLGIWGPH